MSIRPPPRQQHGQCLDRQQLYYLLLSGKGSTTALCPQPELSCKVRQDQVLTGRGTAAGREGVLRSLLYRGAGCACMADVWASPGEPGSPLPRLPRHHDVQCQEGDSLLLKPCRSRGLNHARSLR